MTKVRVDARAVRTKKSIRDAFELMILEMDYSDITVTELTERAGLHRKTFYLHYESIESLFAELEDEIASQLEDICVEIIKNDSDDFEGLSEAYSKVLAKNRKLHERLLGYESYGPVFERVRNRACRFFCAHVMSISEAREDEIEIVAAYMAGGMLSAWRAWYTSGCRYPVERLIAIIARPLNEDLKKLMSNCYIKKFGGSAL